MFLSIPKKLWYVIITTFIVKIILASLLELGNDESYYFTYALQPDFNHFDHPPMVGWLIRLTTLNLNWINDVSLRLTAILSALGCTIWIYKITNTLFNHTAAWYASLLYQACLYSSVIAGLFILPDSPQLFFWLASIFFMCQMVTKQTSSLTQWLLLGFCIGLACLCKIHALYLWAGFGLWLLIKKRTVFLRYPIYLSVACTLICLIPIVWWNMNNHFITYQFHSQRVTHTSLQWDSFMQELIGEIAYQNPVVFVLMILALWHFKKNLFTNAHLLLLICLSIPMIGLFWGVSLFNSTLPHWSGPAYIALIILSGAFIAEKQSKKYLHKLVNISFILISIASLGIVWLAKAAPFNLGSKNEASYGEYCPTLDISGWQNFAEQFNRLYQKDVEQSTMPKQAPIIINKWFPACQIELYVSQKTKQPVISWGKLEDIHKFAWLNKDRPTLEVGQSAYCIVPSNVPLDVNQTYGAYFKEINKPDTIPQMRGGKPVRYFYVYRLKNCLIKQPAMLPY